MPWLFPLQAPDEPNSHLLQVSDLGLQFPVWACTVLPIVQQEAQMSYFSIGSLQEPEFSPQQGPLPFAKLWKLLPVA